MQNRSRKTVQCPRNQPKELVRFFVDKVSGLLVPMCIESRSGRRHRPFGYKKSLVVIGPHDTANQLISSVREVFAFKIFNLQGVDFAAVGVCGICEQRVILADRQ